MENPTLSRIISSGSKDRLPTFQQLAAGSSSKVQWNEIEIVEQPIQTFLEPTNLFQTVTTDDDMDMDDETPSSVRRIGSGSRSQWNTIVNQDRFESLATHIGRLAATKELDLALGEKVSEVDDMSTCMPSDATYDRSETTAITGNVSSNSSTMKRVTPESSPNRGRGRRRGSKQDSNNCSGYKEKDDLGEDQQQMEEGRVLLSTASSRGESELGSTEHHQLFPENKWLDWYWLAGVATSSFLGGFLFYPFNRVMEASHPHERLYAFVLVVCLGGAVDRCLFRYYSRNRPAIARNYLSATPSSLDTGIDRRGEEINTRQIPNEREVNTFQIDDRNRGSSAQRRKQAHPQQRPQRQSTFDEEQQITFYDHDTTEKDSNHRRSNSNETFESDQFFDCLDDIGLDSEHNIIEAGAPAAARPAQIPIQSYGNQIAIYSRRKVVYPDGTLARIPAGECLSTVPPGYLVTYKNESKARARYEQTQRWRHEECIYSVHARPHTWFPRVKAAYPHVVHGFTTDGMPVVYESPGRMNLKELFRNGCRLEDMLFHYCYLMEYLSNLESILTELHSDYDRGNRVEDDVDDEWQDELAAYAHAKQGRLNSDSVPFGFCVVMDISGATPSSLSGDVMTYLKRAGEISSSHYPGSMRRAVAVQAPFWIGVAWKAIKGLLPANVTVDLFSGAQTMGGGLKKYIDEDQIPVEYGGTSKFPLGEHPFEIGLKKLVERQGDADLGESNLEFPSCEEVSPLYDSPPIYFSPGPSLDMDGKMREGSPTSPVEQSTATREWDGIEHGNILTVVAILYFFVHVMIGSLEIALPFWMISPASCGGMGCEPHRIGMAMLASCVLISWTNKRSRFSRLIQFTIQKSPLRGFRIGIGTTCFILTCVSLIPITSDQNKSTLRLLCFSAYLSLIFFGTVLGITSLEHLRGIVIISGEEGGDTLQNVRPLWVTSAIGRIAGYIFVAPVYRWSIRKELSFPLNASFFLCLLACVCWLLYVVSFSIHTAAPSPPLKRSKKKESQFITAMAGWFSFAQELLIVALADVSFLVKELSRKNSPRVYK
mmetsp:Transcript_1658/g.4185  ORF Transcript_1658/g.4185 Transcript_1658/m.4185 type:complete len:1052 (-) Transcript_1658:1353-4508(-)